MAQLDFINSMHNRVRRDYRQRVIEHDKAECATVARRYGEEYWDGDRRYGYGGYRYDGRWRGLADQLVAHWGLRPGQRVLDVGCGKGYLLYELGQAASGLELVGLDVSTYALERGKPELAGRFVAGDAARLPFADDSFDAVVSITTLHNLGLGDARSAFAEMQRVAPKPTKDVCVESWRTESEKANLLYWQLTCQSFHKPEDWRCLADMAGYQGDLGFIYFE